MIERDKSRPRAVFDYNRDVWWRFEELTMTERRPLAKLWKEVWWRRLFEQSVEVPHSPREHMVGKSRISRVVDIAMMEGAIMIRVTAQAVLDWPELERHAGLWNMAKQHCGSMEHWWPFFLFSAQEDV